jgi:hypothetical protein
MLALVANTGGERQPHAMDIYIIIVQIVGSVSDIHPRLKMNSMPTSSIIHSLALCRRMRRPKKNGEKQPGAA